MHLNPKDFTWLWVGTLANTLTLKKITARSSHRAHED